MNIIEQFKKVDALAHEIVSSIEEEMIEKLDEDTRERAVFAALSCLHRAYGLEIRISKEGKK